MVALCNMYGYLTFTSQYLSVDGYIECAECVGHLGNKEKGSSQAHPIEHDISLINYEL